MPHSAAIAARTGAEGGHASAAMTRTIKAPIATSPRHSPVPHMRRSHLFLLPLPLSCCRPPRRPRWNDLHLWFASDARRWPPTPNVISVDEAADALKDFDVIFIGEFPRSPSGKLISPRWLLFSALHARAPALSLSLEQFERDVQTGPRRGTWRTSIGEELLQEARPRVAQISAEAYRPLVRIRQGKQASGDRRPTRPHRSSSPCVGQDGPEALSRAATTDRRAALPPPSSISILVCTRTNSSTFLREDGLHGEPDPDKSKGPTPAEERSFAAQVTRDDTMAELIFLHLQNKSRPQGSSTSPWQFPWSRVSSAPSERLAFRAPQLKVAVVSPVEVENPRAPALKVSDAASGPVLLRASPKRYATEAEENADIERMRAQFGRRSHKPPALHTVTTAPLIPSLSKDALCAHSRTKGWGVAPPCSSQPLARTSSPISASVSNLAIISATPRARAAPITGSALPRNFSLSCLIGEADC